MKNLLVRLGPKAPRYYVQIMAFILIVTYMITPALAVEDMWTAANRIIVDVYNKIAGINTVLAGLMSAVAVIGAKVSNNQHKPIRHGTGSSASGSPGWSSMGLGRFWPISCLCSRVWQR